ALPLSRYSRPLFCSIHEWHLLSGTLLCAPSYRHSPPPTDAAHDEDSEPRSKATACRFIRRLPRVSWISRRYMRRAKEGLRVRTWTPPPQRRYMRRAKEGLRVRTWTPPPQRRYMRRAKEGLR
ncbi:hypothetical protein NHX12_019818, partial [Muraenolepis orangiensis]